MFRGSSALHLFRFFSRVGVCEIRISENLNATPLATSHQPQLESSLLLLLLPFIKPLNPSASARVSHPDKFYYSGAQFVARRWLDVVCSRNDAVRGLILLRFLNGCLKIDIGTDVCVLPQGVQQPLTPVNNRVEKARCRTSVH